MAFFDHQHFGCAGQMPFQRVVSMTGNFFTCRVDQKTDLLFIIGRCYKGGSDWEQAGANQDAENLVVVGNAFDEFQGFLVLSVKQTSQVMISVPG
jgi:hypothetical protein